VVEGRPLGGRGSREGKGGGEEASLTTQKNLAFDPAQEQRREKKFGIKEKGAQVGD